MTAGRQGSRAFLGAVALLAALLVVAVGIREAADRRLLADAERAAAAGDWAEAFRSYRALAGRRPEDGSTRAALDAAADRLLDGVAGARPQDQRRLVAWLAETRRDDALATALDRCTASYPAGWFVMGSEEGHRDEQPERRVHLDAFSIDRYEVTNAQYARFVRAGGDPPPYWAGGSYPAGEAAHPVLAVSWTDAAAYCAWADRRLPTEAEWERACRGTSGRAYPWGDTWDVARANVGTVAIAPVGGEVATNDPAWELLAAPQPPGAPGPRPAGSFASGATPEGVQDLVGNAAEWVADWYDAAGYRTLSSHDPVATGPPWSHAVRGSAWLDRWGRSDWVAGDGRCAARSASHAVADVRTGFRCAADGGLIAP